MAVWWKATQVMYLVEREKGFLAPNLGTNETLAKMPLAENSFMHQQVHWQLLPEG